MNDVARVMCSVYRSRRKAGMYLYVPKGASLDALPEALMAVFGRPEHSMDLLLRRERPLARADVGEVMAALADKGFYLQMPPGDEDDDLYLKGKNDRA